MFRSQESQSSHDTHNMWHALIVSFAWMSTHSSRVNQMAGKVKEVKCVL